MGDILTKSGSMVVRPLSDALGAEVTGIDVTAIDDATLGRLRDALHDNIVIVVREQDLTPKAQAAMTARFGEIQFHISDEFAIPGQSEVVVLTNEVAPDGKPLGNPGAGADWHTDHAYLDRPTGYTFLHGVRIPKEGGDTAWRNMVKAYEILPDATRRRLEGLVGIYTFNRNRNPRMKPHTRPGYGADYYEKRSPPDAFHPLVRTHPFTGRKALYFSARITIGICDMDDREAQPLLDELFAHVDNNAPVYRHTWRKGDLTIWDNRQTMHIALGGVKPPEIRRMHRSTVLGEKPF